MGPVLDTVAIQNVVAAFSPYATGKAALLGTIPVPTSIAAGYFSEFVAIDKSQFASPAQGSSRKRSTVNGKPLQRLRN